MKEYKTLYPIHFSLEESLWNLFVFSHDIITYPIAGHAHGENCYEIHYISDGYGTLFINEITQYALFPNMLYITGPNIHHSQIPDTNNPMREYCLYLKCQSLNTSSDLTKVFYSNPFWIGKASQNCLNLLTNLEFELSRKKCGYLSMVQSYLTQLLICILRLENDKVICTSAQPGKETYTVEPSFIVEATFLDDYATITLSTLAQRLHLSPRQTERFLLLHYQKTFTQMKTEAKISAAKLLLLQTDKSITLIADELHFSSPQHFSTSFKKICGISPVTWRTQNTR